MIVGCRLGSLRLKVILSSDFHLGYYRVTHSIVWLLNIVGNLYMKVDYVPRFRLLNGVFV